MGQEPDHSGLIHPKASERPLKGHRPGRTSSEGCLERNPQLVPEDGLAGRGDPDGPLESGRGIAKHPDRPHARRSHTQR